MGKKAMPNSLMATLPGPGHYEIKEVKKKKNNDQTIAIPFMSVQEGRDGWQRDKDSPFTNPFRITVPGPGYYSKQEKRNAMKEKFFSLLDGIYLKSIFI